jgi:ABC-2 type transport system permease protein
MRLFSEEKKSGSIELLLTYPITDAGVLIGKFLAAQLVLLAMLAGTLTFPLFLVFLDDPDLGTLASGYLGLLLMGGAFMAMGIFLSSLTENQVVAAAVSFGAALMFWVMSWSSSFSGEWLGAILRQLSILEHLDSFHKGVLSLVDISFFALFTAFFLFLTLRSVETYRWRG